MQNDTAKELKAQFGGITDIHIIHSGRFFRYGNVHHGCNYFQTKAFALRCWEYLWRLGAKSTTIIQIIAKHFQELAPIFGYFLECIVQMWFLMEAYPMIKYSYSLRSQDFELPFSLITSRTKSISLI